MRLRKLSYLTLWAVRFDEIKRLYKEVLGLQVSRENENFILFETEGIKLAFHRVNDAPPLERPTAELHLEVRDVDEIYAALEAKGIRFKEKPANHPGEERRRSASFQDPEGYTVELVGPLKPGELAKGERSSERGPKLPAFS